MSFPVIMTEIQYWNIHVLQPFWTCVQKTFVEDFPCGSLCLSFYYFDAWSLWYFMTSECAGSQIKVVLNMLKFILSWPETAEITSERNSPERNMNVLLWCIHKVIMTMATCYCSFHISNVYHSVPSILAHCKTTLLSSKGLRCIPKQWLEKRLKRWYGVTVMRRETETKVVRGTIKRNIESQSRESNGAKLSMQSLNG